VRDVLANGWSLAVRSDWLASTPPGTGLSPELIASTAEAFVVSGLERMRCGDFEGLAETCYETARALVSIEAVKRISLADLYTAARLGLQALDSFVGPENRGWALAHGKLTAHLLVVLGIAYSDAREEALQRARDQLERVIDDRTAALAKEKEVADTIIESLPSIFYLFDEEGRFLRWNRNFASVSAYSAEEIARMNPVQFFEGEGRDHVAARIAEVLETGQSTAEADFVSKNGTRTPYFFTGRRVLVDGRTCVIGMGIDVTERKRAAEAIAERSRELQRSNADLEQFAYVASHDLQEPLRAVASYSQLLARRYQHRLDGDALRFIDRMSSAVSRMQALIRDLLAYSRVGTRGEVFGPADCERLLREVLDDLQAAVGETGAVVTHDPLPTLPADSSQIRQLLQNLIGNAIKFRGAEPPRVHVSACRDGDAWLFTVRDNGIGIDPEFAERVFVIFQRLHSRRAYPGTGVGLAICKKIVERHGGRIWIEPRTKGGTTVCFEMPSERADDVIVALAAP
jgi:PAS domain S-box-containing protein